MCYRYSQTKDKIAEIIARTSNFDVNTMTFFHTNGFAHQSLPVLTIDQPDIVQPYIWGEIPHYIKTRQEANKSMHDCLNARSESIFEKPSFRQYIMKKRCLIPASGFFDFHHAEGGKKYPYYVMVKDDDNPDTERGFCFAGLYSHWVDAITGETLRTFTMITQEANEPMKFIHNSKERMPLMLQKDDEEKWLDPNLSRAEVERILETKMPDNKIRAYTIGKMLTNTKIDANVPEVIMKVDSAHPSVPAIIDWSINKVP